MKHINSKGSTENIIKDFHIQSIVSIGKLPEKTYLNEPKIKVEITISGINAIFNENIYTTMLSIV